MAHAPEPSNQLPLLTQPDIVVIACLHSKRSAGVNCYFIFGQGSIFSIFLISREAQHCLGCLCKMSHAVEYLPSEAGVAEVCAWLLTLTTDMNRYFPAVTFHDIDGARMYHDSLEDLLACMGVISLEHQTLILNVSFLSALAGVCTLAALRGY